MLNGFALIGCVVAVVVAASIAERLSGLAQRLGTLACRRLSDRARLG